MTTLLTTVLAIGVLAGCSEKTPGSANTTAPTSGEQTSNAPTSNEPSSGLSIAKFVSKPCDVLTATQVAKLGNVSAPKAGTSDTLGPTCEWTGKVPTDNSSYTVYVTENKDVEQMVSNVKTNPIFKDKKVGDVRVIVNDSTDGTLHCRAIIEVSKTDSVTVDVRTAYKERASKPSCTDVESVATMAIETLKG
ncbi:MAG TPA: DUF3558 domain-containing protein [Lentzea sp.]